MKNKKEKTNCCYLVDSENVKDTWIDLLDIMEERDRLLVFYTANSSHIRCEQVEKIMQKNDGRMLWIQCFEGNNALDFQLVTCLGAMVAEQKAGEYVIISKDTGFDAVVKFWRRDGIRIRRSRGAVEEARYLESHRNEAAGLPEKSRESYSGNKGQKKVSVKTEYFVSPVGDRAGQALISAPHQSTEWTEVSGAWDKTGQRPVSEVYGEPERKSGSEANAEAEPQSGIGAYGKPEPEERPVSEPYGKSEPKSSAGSNEEPMWDGTSYGKPEPEQPAISPVYDGQADRLFQDGGDAFADEEATNKEGKHGGKKHGKKLKDKKEKSIARMAKSIDIGNMSMFHNALVAFFGADEGDVYYNELKKLGEGRKKYEKMYLKDKHQRVRNYVELILEMDKKDTGDAPDLYRLLSKSPKKDLQKLNSLLNKKYDNKKAIEYYRLIRRHINILKKL